MRHCFLAKQRQYTTAALLSRVRQQGAREVADTHDEICAPFAFFYLCDEGGADYGRVRVLPDFRNVLGSGYAKAYGDGQTRDFAHARDETRGLRAQVRA